MRKKKRMQMNTLKKFSGNGGGGERYTNEANAIW